ncbi:uncharacterized protein EAE98_004893 [Botrytis deweyae]|uniref:MYND-type domain-containing protein n=1 Tax=Botrytis deweyae TaxID=2478750 RepID=A0ABQ7IPN9_9HELO|nr:uncharacterized protein EAE98_004893 [Botrytis deweyae]KAF7930493.1 hypothetical protein EAE98_004893 [Botrytis deweyae]
MDLAEDSPYTTMDGNAASAPDEKEMQHRSNSGGMMDGIMGKDRLDEDVSEERCSRSGCPSRFKKDGFNCKECQSQIYCSNVCAERHWPEHKLTCECLNYVLSIDMCFERYRNNRPGCIMSCPARATFEDFYQALSISLPCLEPVYRFYIFDRGQINAAISHYPRPEKIITRPGSSSSVLDYRPDLRQLLGQIQKTWQYMTLFMDRAPISPFLLMWSGAFRCIEDYGKGQNFMTLRLAYEASEPTQEQRELLSWYESIKASKATREGINQTLSLIRTVLFEVTKEMVEVQRKKSSSRTIKVHILYNECEAQFNMGQWESTPNEIELRKEEQMARCVKDNTTEVTY